MLPSATVSQLVDEWSSRAKSLRTMGMHKEASVLERCADDLTQRIKEATTGTTATRKPISPCCMAKLLWKQIGGMRVYRDVNGEKLYEVMCSECRSTYEIKDPT